METVPSGRRWLILAVFALNSAGNSFMWMDFVSLPDGTKQVFGYCDTTASASGSSVSGAFDELELGATAVRLNTEMTCRTRPPASLCADHCCAWLHRRWTRARASVTDSSG